MAIHFGVRYFSKYILVHRVFPGGKVRLGRDSDPSPPSSAEVKDRMELYLYST